MAKNVKVVTFTKTADVSVDVVGVNVVNDNVVAEILAGADLQTVVVKKKAGRKPKAEEDSAKAVLRIYLTDVRKIAVEEYCKKRSMAVSSLINQLLIEKGIINVD